MTRTMTRTMAHAWIVRSPAAAQAALAMLLVGCGPQNTPQPVLGGDGDATPARDNARATSTSSTNAPSTAPPVRDDGTVYGEATMMGTHWSINVYISAGKTPADAGAAIRAAMAEVSRIEMIASEWQADSELSRLNRRAGAGPHPVSVELFEILEISKEVSEATQGTFDVSFHAVGSLWKFTPGSTPPADEDVAARLALVDHTKINLNKSAGTASLSLPGMALGLGAIAKGYAVDRAVAVMRAHGFHDVIVEGGGDVYLAGSKGETSWHVGIQDPAHNGAIGKIDVRDQAVVTSGNYQRFFEHEGTRYAHILDPRTGRPVPYARSPRSVSVIARDTARADAYATALAVMGVAKGIEFAATVPMIEALMIDAAGVVHLTPGLEQRFDRLTP